MKATRYTSNRAWLRAFLGLVLAVTAASCERIPQWIDRLPEIAPDTDSSPEPATPVQSPQTAEMETQIRQRINEIRQQQGLSTLQPNEKLAEVARRYSQQMAEQNFFSHTSPTGSTMVERVRSAGILYSYVGENLFTSTNIPQPVDAAVEGWMNSPGHRENILRPQFRETGIGVWQNGNKYYVTQLFLRPFGF